MRRGGRTVLREMLETERSQHTTVLWVMMGGLAYLAILKEHGNMLFFNSFYLKHFSINYVSLKFGTDDFDFR